MQKRINLTMLYTFILFEKYGKRKCYPYFPSGFFMIFIGF